MTIEAQEKKLKFQSESVRDLRIAVEALKRDFIGYKTLLESVLSTDNKIPLDDLFIRYSDSLLFLMPFIDSIIITKPRRGGRLADPQFGTWSRKAAFGAKSTPVDVLSDAA
jgi:hypothetical protein